MFSFNYGHSYNSRWAQSAVIDVIEVLTFLLVVITAIYAYLTFRILQAATRPYVIVAFSRERSGFYSFKVSNVGHSAAKQLRVKSDPEIKPVKASGNVTQAGTVPPLIGFFHHSIPYLAPSQNLEALVGHYSGIKASYPQLLFKVSLHYDGIGGPYEEAIELSLEPTDDAQHLMDYDVGKDLHEIRKMLNGIKFKSEP